ncbi:MAG: bifunctional metallophosphatase/5'-nucleotidase [Succinivibrionaceae bacterium]
MKFFKYFSLIRFSAFIIIPTCVSCTSHTSSSLSSSLDSNNDFESQKVSTSLKILHINDTHSYIQPQPVVFSIDNKTITLKSGGIPTLTSYIKKEKQKSQNVLIISAGDQIVGYAPNYDKYKGKLDAIAHGLLGTNYYILGNHEFDYGIDGVNQFINFMKSKAPNSILLNTNIQNLKGFVAYQDKNIGLYGIVSSDKIKNSSISKNITFKDSINSVNEQTKILKNKGINIHILVSHQGMEQNIKDAKKFNDIDIIISGDSHELLGDFKALNIKTNYSFPVLTTNAKGNKVCIVEAYEYGKTIGNLDVNFDKNGNVISCKGSTKFLLENDKYNLTKTNYLNFELVEPDKEAIQVLSPYLEEIKQNDSKLGIVKEPLCSSRSPTDFCVVKNSVAKNGSETCHVLSQIYLDYFNKLDYKIDLVLLNSGAFRVDIYEGDLYSSYLKSVIPYKNTFAIIKLKGSEFKKIISDELKYIMEDHGSRSGGFPCGYGFSYHMELNSPNYLESLIVKEKDTSFLEIDLNKDYYVLVNNYIKQGKDGYRLLKDKKNLLKNNQLNVDDISIIEKYLQKNSSLPLNRDKGTIY